MSQNPNLITGALKLLGSFDIACYKSWPDAVQGLIDMLAVQFQVSQITNVLVSNTQPSSAEVNDVWFKLDNSGNFVGIFLYSGAEWVQRFPPPNEIIWMFGDSTDIPTGYSLIDSSNANFTATQVTFLQNFWHLDASGLFFDIFQVTQD